MINNLFYNKINNIQFYVCLLFFIVLSKTEINYHDRGIFYGVNDHVCIGFKPDKDMIVI